MDSELYHLDDGGSRTSDEACQKSHPLWDRSLKILGHGFDRDKPVSDWVGSGQAQALKVYVIGQALRTRDQKLLGVHHRAFGFCDTFHLLTLHHHHRALKLAVLSFPVDTFMYST